MMTNNSNINTGRIRIFQERASDREQQDSRWVYLGRLPDNGWRVHEDNMGAMRPAQLEPGCTTPRSKFYALKLHWFRSWLQPNNIEIIHCPTQEQKADFLTKALGPTAFKACRLLSMGW